MEYLLLEYLTYRLIEKPGRALGEKVINKLTAKRVRKARVLQMEEQRFMAACDETQADIPRVLARRESSLTDLP